MNYTIEKFPQFQDKVIFIAFFKNIEQSVISKAKNELVAGNKDFDFCFLNTEYIISLEHLYNSIHKSILNFEENRMKARTLNTEFILNLSPVNNITESLRRFGINENCPNLILIKVMEEHTSNISAFDSIYNHACSILSCEGLTSAELNDTLILNELADIKKLKKLYKLNDVSLPLNALELQSRLTRLIINTCHLRGC